MASRWRQVSKYTLCKCGQHFENEMKLTTLPFLRFKYVDIFFKKVRKSSRSDVTRKRDGLKAVWETFR